MLHSVVHRRRAIIKKVRRPLRNPLRPTRVNSVLSAELKTPVTYRAVLHVTAFTTPKALVEDNLNSRVNNGISVPVEKNRRSTVAIAAQ